MKYIGLDVHKDSITASIVSEGGKLEKNMKVDACREGLNKILNYVGSKKYCVMMESSTYAYLPYRFFDESGIETYMIHAHSFKVITDTDRKTDKLDSDKLGRYLRLYKKKEIELSMSFVPTREECELKDICRYEEELSKKKSDNSRRILAHLARNYDPIADVKVNLNTKKFRNYLRRNFSNDITLMMRLDEYEYLLQQSNKIVKEIKSRSICTDSNVKLLSEIPGVGIRTAVQLMSMIVDINRFDNAEKLCSYFGLVPRVRDSGEKENHGKMTKAVKS